MKKTWLYIWIFGVIVILCSIFLVLAFDSDFTVTVISFIFFGVVLGGILLALACIVERLDQLIEKKEKRETPHEAPRNSSAGSFDDNEKKQ